MAPSNPIPDPVSPTKKTAEIVGGEEKAQPDTTRPFRSFMEGGEPNPLLSSGTSPQVSPFDLAHGRVPAPGPNFNTIQDQAKMASSALGDVAGQLKTKNLKLKQSTKYLLKNKLNSAKGHIKSAAAKMGAPITEDSEEPSGAGIVGKFLGLVTSGQNQLQAAQAHLAKLSKKGDQLKPADMLLIQIKLSKAQQELEYSSVLLGKAMDDLKQLMNIQL